MKRMIAFILLTIILQLFTEPSAAQYDQKLELFVETGHTYSVQSATFSPDGKLLASSSYDGVIKLWNSSTGQDLKTFKGSSNWSNPVAFSPDSKILASGGSDGVIKLWNIEYGLEQNSFTGHSSEITSIVFSPDGRMLASASWDETVKLWEVISGKLLITLKGHSSLVNSIAFSSDGKTLASGSADSTIKLWSLESGNEIKTFKGHLKTVNCVAFSPDGKTIASGSDDDTIKFWNVQSGQQLKTISKADGGNTMFYSAAVKSIVFSPDGKTLASGGNHVNIKIWDVQTGRQAKLLIGKIANHSVSFSPDGKTLISAAGDKTLKLWNFQTGLIVKTFEGHTNSVESISISSDGKRIASAGDDNIKLWNLADRNILSSYFEIGVSQILFSPDGNIIASATEDEAGGISLWDVANGEKAGKLSGHNGSVSDIVFSPDGKILASASWDNTVKLWNINNEAELMTLKGHTGQVWTIAFSPDGKILASGSFDKTIKLWDTKTGAIIKTLDNKGTDSPAKELMQSINSIVFSPDGKILASTTGINTVKLWDVDSGKILKTYYPDNLETFREVSAIVPDFFSVIQNEPKSSDGKIQIKKGNNNTINLFDTATEKILASLITINILDWIVTTPEGRFDTSKSLDKIEGLHWIVNDEILNPLSLDVFMRQYYEPNLLTRVLKCNEENNCDKEFKPLPSIAEINRVQPKVLIKDVREVKDSADLVDVTVEVESVTEDVSVSATDRAKKEKKTSGVFDLRLFRDEQLVGVSAPQENLEKFIKDAPRLVEETRKSGKLIDTPEDRAWRAANDVFGLTAENVNKISANKIEYTFRNVRLPKDGREAVEFKAYAFNSDKVKSQTTEPFKFQVPKAISAEKKKGKAVLISIGVNASENPAYDLRYAANDAREMQKIVGGNLLKEKGAKYADVILIPIVSDHKTEQFGAVNTAQKEIIKGVFALLAGRNYKDVLAEIEKVAIEKKSPQLSTEFQKIPNLEKLSQIDPEDTLIISFSGHGYADSSGIFYLLPFDIGADTTKLTTENLNKMISSDELSLWMQDITSAEMMMIIDACHSSAAVQGDGFKPGPMASRGLGQLAYDKDMKILSATQANNVALELGSLQQGLLSYALLQDGIMKSLADADNNKQMLPAEWLSYSESRVPELYKEVLDGKRGVIINGKNIKQEEIRSGIYKLDGNQKSNVNLQQPSLFDFKRRNKPNTLFNLP